MRGIYGLVIALALGIAAAMLNWNYLRTRAEQVQTESFVGVAPGVTLNVGDRFDPDRHFIEVPIPKNHIGGLRNVAVLWETRNTLSGAPVVREFKDGQLVMLGDLKTPSESGRPLNENETRLGVPVDSRTFVARWFQAGDMVSFIVPRSAQTLLADGTPAPASSPTEEIGPFEIWAVGDRVGSIDVVRGDRQSASQQNVLNIVVRKEAGELEPKAQRLAALLVTDAFRNVVVLKHPPKGGGSP